MAQALSTVPFLHPCHPCTEVPVLTQRSRVFFSPRVPFCAKRRSLQVWMFLFWSCASPSLRFPLVLRFTTALPPPVFRNCLLFDMVQLFLPPLFPSPSFYGLTFKSGRSFVPILVFSAPRAFYLSTTTPPSFCVRPTSGYVVPSPGPFLRGAPNNYISFDFAPSAMLPQPLFSALDSRAMRML